MPQEHYSEHDLTVERRMSALEKAVEQLAEKCEYFPERLASIEVQLSMMARRNGYSRKDRWIERGKNVGISAGILATLEIIARAWLAAHGGGQ